MPSALLNDDAIWGLPGAKVAEPRKGADAFCETPLWELLCQGAAHDPEAVALVGRSSALRYGELLRIAQNTAAALAARIAPGEAVACLLPRRPEAIAALLGCLISGRVCLIIDPANPALRLRDLLMDLAPAALLLAEMPPLRYDAPALMLADVLAGPDRIWRPDAAPDPDVPLSVHMTSGSSGRPKGIALSARSVLYRALSNLSDMQLTQADCFVMPSGPFAAAGLSALIGALACGARCVLTSFAEDGAGTTLRLIERERVTCAVFQPPMLRVLLSLDRAPAAFAAMRCLRIGAAGLPRADLVALRQSLPSDCAVWHTYASTEALFVASWQIPPDDSGPEATVAVGMLEPDHDYALLDEAGRPVAPGEPGELVLRGRYLALGEWRQGHVVPGRMLPVPNRPGWRCFRTGDLLQVQPDGLLRLLGRVDRQVKINGVRIEPAEIEAVLRTEPGVTDAAVVAVPVSGSVTLHGFVASLEPDHAALIMALRQRLAASLPMTLRVSKLTVLPQLPSLPAGKTDVNALARLAASPAAPEKR
jgi:acyl-CoA synthetase (AMP-forming)/AMP-acid ligase II